MARRPRCVRVNSHPSAHNLVPAREVPSSPTPPGLQQLSLLGPGLPPVDPASSSHSDPHAPTIERPGLRLRLWPRWLAEPVLWQQRLEQEVAWRQEQITLWGRTHPLPRLTCWMGDPGCAYTYSGVNNVVVPWSAAVQELRQRIEEQVGWSFNSLLLNLYRDGRDKLDWHADDEPELDPAAPIASLSLGACRSFRLRPACEDRDPGDALSFELGEGDLLVMDPPTQEHWQHQVPRRLRLQQPRLNLTFRSIRPETIRRAEPTP